MKLYIFVLIVLSLGMFFAQVQSKDDGSTERSAAKHTSTVKAKDEKSYEKKTTPPEDLRKRTKPTSKPKEAEKDRLKRDLKQQPEKSSEKITKKPKKEKVHSKTSKWLKFRKKFPILL